MSLFPLLIGRGHIPEEGIRVFSEDEPYEIGFAEHYEANLGPQVEEFEKSRIAAIKRARSRLLLMLPVLAAVLLFGYYVLSSSDCGTNYFSSARMLY